MSVVIRSWQKEDLEALRNITWQAWMTTYSNFIPEEDLQSYFHLHYTETALRRMFHDPFMWGFVAEVDFQIAGYLRLFFNHEENRLYIPSFYMLQDFQGQTIGTQLLESAEKFAAQKGLDELWIGVMVQNRPAHLFYRKMGFQFIKEEPFTMGKTVVSHLIGYKKLRRAIPLTSKIFGVFEGREGFGRGALLESQLELKQKESMGIEDTHLPHLCLNLLSNQKENWGELRKGYLSLQDVKEREISCRGFSVRLQYNPQRIKSSMARLPPQNGNEEPCFLCLDHLPKSQRGILFQEDYLILCNPMPVFPFHFTVSHLDHRHQTIAEHIGSFLQLMRNFDSGWAVLYNGPRCGASSPNHLHFQVIPSGKLPIEKEITEEERLTMMIRKKGVLLHCIKNLGREVLLIEGDDPIPLADIFKRFLNGLKKVLLIEEEPMINVAGYYKDGRWHLLIFPRRKHRPDAFFKDGEDRMIVSPGVIDMGGLFITPIQKDFERLDVRSIEGIYQEVSLEGKEVERAIIILQQAEQGDGFHPPL